MVDNQNQEQETNVVSETAKKESKRLAKRGVRNAIGTTSKATLAKLKGASLKSFGQFLITPPWGWVTTGVLFVGFSWLIGADHGNQRYLSDGQMVSKDGESIVFNNDYTQDDPFDAYVQDNGLRKKLMKPNGCPETKRPSGDSPVIGDIPSGSIGDADWTLPGSKANQTAKKVFDSWIDKGLSGAAAAGIVGWVNSEGGFSMIGRAEGHFGNDLSKNSIMYGIIPTKMPWYTTEGGGGIYQFTPYTKYAPLSSTDWEDADKMNAFVGKEILRGDWNASMDLTGGNHSFNDMAKETDPQKATLMWQAYERGSVAHIDQNQKKRDAQKAYDMFDGGKYKYDNAKFESAFGKTSGGSSNNDKDEQENTTSGKKNPCATVRSEGGDGWQKPGGQPSINSGIWRPQDLPDELKEYALDPSSVGLEYGKSGGWVVTASTIWNQCTDLSANLMHHLWSKDGEKPKQALGNGGDVAQNWANAFGGSTTKKPVSGAVFSQRSPDLPGPWGHTGVVSHVFDNGEILVVEQNWGRFSGGGGSPPGDANGPGPYTWNYRYITKHELPYYTFYNPGDQGFEVNPDAKSL